MVATPAADLPAATRLAVERTRLAHDRTLMAWVRTATSLISFGFTVYKFFEYLRENRPPVERLIGPRDFALIMIGTGLVALILATHGHYRSIRALRAEYGPLVPASLSGIFAGMVGLFGILLFVAVFFRL